MLTMSSLVYALYKRNKFIMFLFLALLVAEIVAVVVGIVMNVPGDSFRAVNVLVTSPNSYTYFG